MGLRRSGLSALVAGVAGSAGLLASPAAAGITGDLTVTPSTGLHDGQAVAIDLVGPPDSDMLVIECHDPRTNFFAECGGAFGVSTSTGTYTTTFVVQRTFTSQNGTDVECDAAHPCALTMWVVPPGAQVPTLVDTVPISFSSK